MKILVLSESFIIRDSLNHLLNETLNTNDIITSSNANHLSNEDLLEVDLSFIDINKNNINIVERLSKIRNKFENLKIMILDSQKDIELFIKSVDYGIDGYILNIDDKDEFIYTWIVNLNQTNYLWITKQLEVSFQIQLLLL